MRHTILYFLFLYSIPALPQSGEALIPMFYNQQWGFINVSGKEQIAPKFQQAMPFTDSLAAVRINGAWGFINRKGDFVIPPVYDFVTSFSNGRASAWKDGVPSLIDSKGAVVFELDGGRFRLWQGFTDREVFGFIRPGDNKQQPFVLRRNGEIEPFQSLQEQPKRLLVLSRSIPYGMEYAIQDSTGKMIVPFGRYKYISLFQNGFAEVHIPQKGSQERTGILNEEGKLILTLPLGNEIKHVENPGFSDHLAVVDLNWKDDRFLHLISEFISYYRDSLKHASTTFEQACRIGKLDMETQFYSIVDSTGNYITKEKFNEIHPVGFQQEGLLVQIWESPRPENYAPRFELIRQRWGLLDRQGKWVIPPTFTHVGPEGFQNGLLYVEVDSLCGYVKQDGKFVWSTQKQPVSREAPKLNVDYMAPVSYYAYSGRNRMSANPFMKKFVGTGVGIEIRTDEPGLFRNKYTGVTAYLYNATPDTLQIDVQDKQLYMVLQAQDAFGEWKDIEYLPSSFCGNSYYHIPMPPNEYWAFKIPIYDGDFSTSFRLAFSQEDTHFTHTRIYSNTFPGKVNRTQFWRQKRDMSTLDICDN